MFADNLSSRAVEAPCLSGLCQRLHTDMILSLMFLVWFYCLRDRKRWMQLYKGDFVTSKVHGFTERFNQAVG